jgi:hypothetical protein
MRDWLSVVCIILAAAPLAANAQRPIYPHGEPKLEEPEKEEWKDEQPDPPAFPLDSNLIPFAVSGGSSNRFFIDRNSLSIGSKDGVVRFTTVIKSESGVRNVLFEGIRCDTREKKLYATGRDDGTWSPAHSSDWQAVEYKNLNGYHRLLFSDFFCPAKLRVTSVDEAVKALKAGIHPMAKVRR